MEYKVIMTWDITPEKEREYFEFVIREFIPRLEKLGFHLDDAWATAFGKQPQILIGASLPNAQEVKRTLSSESWKNLHEQLSPFVQNFSLKVAEAKKTFQF